MMYGWIIGLILFVVLIVILGRASIFQSSNRANAIRENNDSALETLKKRYARGEINKDEFEERKAELEK